MKEYMMIVRGRIYYKKSVWNMLILRTPRDINWRIKVCNWTMGLKVIGQVRTGDIDMGAESI